MDCKTGTEIYLHFHAMDDFYNKICASGCVNMIKVISHNFIFLEKIKEKKYISEYIDNKSIYNNKKKKNETHNHIDRTAA